MKKKSVAFLLALVLVFGMAVGGTVAWLMDSTDPVVNTFTVGDIEITLTEEAGKDVDGKRQFKVVPGVDISKDPKVTVLKDSEKCWLFVKVEKSANWNENLSYSIASGWTELTEGSGIYWRTVEATTKDEPFYVLADNKIVVSEDLEGGELATSPTLTFTAYAIQQEKFANAAAAWAALNPGFTD